MATKEVFYFSHDYSARNDPKLVKVLMKLGQAGKGVYWDLVEMLFEQSGYLMLSECSSYAFALHTDEQCITSLINDFDLFQNDGTRFWSDSVLRRISERSERAKKAKESADKRWSDKRLKQSQSEGNANAMQTQCDPNAIKERKGKERKGNNNTPLPPGGGEWVQSFLSENANPPEQGEIPVKPVEGPKVPAEWEADFKWFWDAYGKKADRQKSERKFKTLTKTERAAVREHVPKYVESTPDVKYRKNPLTYLNGQCWTDEIPASAGSAGGAGSRLSKGGYEMVL